MAKNKNEATENNFLSQMTKAAENWNGPKAVTVENKRYFVQQLLQGNSLRDLQKRTVKEAETALSELWEKIQRRSFADIRIDIQEDAYGQDGRVDITIIQRQIPFITDSILSLLAQEYLSVSVMLNASFKVRRDDDGRLLTMHDDDDHGPDAIARVADRHGGARLHGRHAQPATHRGTLR